MNKDEVLNNIKNKNLFPKSICNIRGVTVIDTSIISVEYYKTVQSRIIKKEPYTVYLATERKEFSSPNEFYIPAKSDLKIHPSFLYIIKGDDMKCD